MNKITLTLCENKDFVRCTFCGGRLFTNGSTIATSQDGEIVACATCIAMDITDDDLEAEAKRLEAHAKLLRSLIGRLIVPTADEWLVDLADAQAQRDEVDIPF